MFKRLIAKFKRLILKQNIPTMKGERVVAKMGPNRTLQKGTIINIVIDSNSKYFVIACDGPFGWGLDKSNQQNLSHIIRWGIPTYYLGTSQTFWICRQNEIVKII